MPSERRACSHPSIARSEHGEWQKLVRATRTTGHRPRRAYVTWEPIITARTPAPAPTPWRACPGELAAPVTGPWDLGMAVQHLVEVEAHRRSFHGRSELQLRTCYVCSGPAFLGAYIYYCRKLLTF